MYEILYSDLIHLTDCACRSRVGDVAVDGGDVLQVDIDHDPVQPEIIMPRFHVPAEEAKALMHKLGCSRKELLKSMLQSSSTLARAPISLFHVGAVGMTPAGDVYVGVNLEFLRMPLNNSVHAEQCLIANLRHHGETVVDIIAVNAAPCGHCRQFLSELQCSDTVQFVFGDEAEDTFSLAQLLPMRFRPQDLLGDDPPPLLLSPQNNSVGLSPAAEAALSDRGSDDLFQRAAGVALQEAQQSYAPYSLCPAGVAMVTEDGSVHGGAYLESVAYNPSMQALQTAITHAVIHGMPCYTHVVEVLVAEIPDQPVHHTSQVQFLLQAIAPNATVTEIPLQRRAS
eukprot:jgi/Ulvmu1/4095/UM019_0074.1